MTGNHTLNNNSLTDDDKRVHEFILLLWSKKINLLLTACFFALLGGLYSLTLPNIYRAEALLAPADENSGGGLTGLSSQLGGLASLAGVNLGKSNMDKATQAIEILESRIFLVNFIKKRQLEINLLAASKWDKTTNELIIDPELYDKKNHLWADELLVDNNKTPSDWDIYLAIKNILNVSQDKTTGLINISIQHISPTIAKDWVEWLIKDINQYMRNVDIQQTKLSIEFLNQQIQSTVVADMQSMFYKLIEKQYQTMLLANAREEYIFNVLDPAIVPQEKIKPKRAAVVFLCFLFGLSIAIISVVIRNMTFYKGNGLMVSK